MQLNEQQLQELQNIINGIPTLYGVQLIQFFQKVSQDNAPKEEDVKEILINGKTYYITNEINGLIYDLDEDGEISLEVGKYKKGVPEFY